MANNIKLECYTVRIRKEREINNYLLLNSFENGSDFFSYILKYINTFDKKLLLDNAQKKSLRFNNQNLLANQNKRTISGIIESGDYDYVSHIYDINTGKRNYIKKITDTDIRPFYFYFSIPKEQNKAILVLQRMGIYGIHSVFSNHLKLFFKKILMI